MHEIQNKGGFKALPLNKKLFQPIKLGTERSLSRLESTKFKEFTLSSAPISRQNSDPKEQKIVFKANPLPKTTY